MGSNHVGVPPAGPSALTPSTTGIIGPATPCTITFGHNATDHLVCMLFSTPATQLVFSPTDAEDVARKLQYYARCARGEAVT